MYQMEKKATGADRARKRIHTAGEALEPTFADGMVQVQTARAATVHALRRKGWRVVSHQSKTPQPKPTPVPTPEVESPSSRSGDLKDLTVKELRHMARALSIRGRSAMTEDELIAAIMAAEA